MILNAFKWFATTSFSCAVALGLIWGAWKLDLIPKTQPHYIFILCKPPGIPA
jgi:hypothetical protein